jgi:hypothetical protein
MNYGGGGGGGGSFVVKILNRGRFIRPRSLEPKKLYLITYAWKVGSRANTLVRLGLGDYLWMFLPFRWRFYIADAELQRINVCMCYDMYLVSWGILPMGGPADLKLIRTFKRSIETAWCLCFFQHIINTCLKTVLFHSSLKHFLNLYISNKHACCYTATTRFLNVILSGNTFVVPL